MVNLHAKYLWPLVGIVVFIVLIALYVDDRRKLEQEKTVEMASEHTAHETGSDDTQTSVADEPVPAHATAETHSGPAGDSLTDMRSERSDELASAVTEHRGFSGSIEYYLSTEESRQESTHESSSMSIDEYLSSTGN